MSLQQWALPQLAQLVPLDEGELKQIISYTETLPDADAAKHLENLLGDSPQALAFVASFNEHRASLNAETLPPQVKDTKLVNDIKNGKDTLFHPGNGVQVPPQSTSIDSKYPNDNKNNGRDAPQSNGASSAQPPNYAPPSYPPPANGASRAAARTHTNAVIEAGKIRSQDEVCTWSRCMTCAGKN